MPEEVQKDEGQETRDFLAQALKRFKLAEEAESETRRLALDDLKFSLGEQWDGGIKSARQADGRPCLVINHLPKFIRQLVNEERQQRPAIHVNPVGDGATVESAEIMQGVVRHIERNSEAGTAYDHAFEMMVRTGFGYWRVHYDYVKDNSFEQEIFIQRIKNPFTVYFDPSATEADYSDAKWVFIVEEMAVADFKEKYPNAEAATSDLSSIGDKAPGWLTKESIRIAEYFYVEEEKRTIYQLADGSIVAELPLDPVTQQPIAAAAIAQREEVNQRVQWCKMTALDKLETTPWPGRWIPIVPVLGEDIDVDGKRYLSGLIRNAKDPQRMSNYWKSAATETIALAPKSPFILAEGQVEDYEKKWEEANVKNFAYLPYKPISASGQPVPPPQRQFAEPPVQAFGAMISGADSDLQDTMGIYLSSLGGPGPETSGRAIIAKKQQTNTSTYGFLDNLSRAIRHTGRIVLELVPKIYTMPRIQRIVNPDTSIDQVIIYNGQEQQQVAQGMLSERIRKAIDVTAGRYDVTVSSGPSYQSKREEASASMVELLRVYPQAMNVMGDLLLRSMDWPGAQEMADRLKKLLPPQILSDDQTDPKIQLMKAQQQLQQAMQQIELMSKALNEMTEAMKSKKMELDSKERISAQEQQTKLILAELQANREAGLETLKAQLATISGRLEKLVGQPTEAM